ncbi:LON peptidase substrate-binding domain-containing protein [uncultured Photobacterium sp.]|uniref:LON peptidase substrate-binding domain-containing protein n=1 Tax=uncultured Photobacterium sp. TaxID=173973 RepID=UPI00261BC071|nr:LON peptidase substrate-binding domain-containing protein [uncultured Photobacterium sp.]
MSEITLFPSSKHLLPQGRLAVTIAEDRYIHMIKQSLAEKQDFALCMLNESEEHDEIKKIPAIATKGIIVDFNSDECGLLSVIIEGQQKIRLLSIQIAKNGLLIAKYEPYPTWDTAPIDNATACLSKKLKLFYATLPEIGALYPTPAYNDITWVCQRWLEILPLEVHYKQLLITQENTKLTIRFLLKLLDNNEIPTTELI